MEYDELQEQRERELIKEQLELEDSYYYIVSRINRETDKVESIFDECARKAKSIIEEMEKLFEKASEKISSFVSSSIDKTSTICDESFADINKEISSSNEYCSNLLDFLRQARKEC